MTLWRSFDWILCLEVGEHVPKQCAVRIVRTMHAGGWWLAVVVGKSRKLLERHNPLRVSRVLFLFFCLKYLVTVRISKNMAAKFHVLMMKTCDIQFSIP